MTIKTLNIDYSYARLVQATLAAFLLLAGLYVYLVSTIVWDAANREKARAQASELSSKVATLESDYVNLSGEVTLELASHLGFVETSNQGAFALARPKSAFNN